MKLLGIDYGEAHVGLALGQSQSIAVPLAVVKNDGTLIDTLIQIITEEHIEKIIIGWPKSMSGSVNERTHATDVFIDSLKDRVDVPIIPVDERLTSKAAKAQGVKGRVDAVAAADILQSYIDRDDL